MSGKWNIYSPNLNGQDLPEHPTGFIRKWRRKKTPDVYLGKLCQPLWVKLHFYFFNFLIPCKLLLKNAHLVATWGMRIFFGCSRWWQHQEPVVSRRTNTHSGDEYGNCWWWGWGTPPPNMAPWHIEYFKLKEFEKIAEAGRSLWPPTPLALSS